MALDELDGGYLEKTIDTAVSNISLLVTPARSDTMKQISLKDETDFITGMVWEE